MSETCGRCKRPLWSGEGWPEATFCRFSAGMREECYRIALDTAERHLSACREAWQACRAALEMHAEVRRTERGGALHYSQDDDDRGCLCRWCLTRRALALDPEKAAAGGEEGACSTT